MKRGPSGVRNASSRDSTTSGGPWSTAIQAASASGVPRNAHRRPTSPSKAWRATRAAVSSTRTAAERRASHSARATKCGRTKLGIGWPSKVTPSRRKASRSQSDCSRAAAGSASIRLW